jgi:hypothetical protein
MEGKVFQPVSEMLDSGQCEPLKAAVHGVVMVLAGVCALYNTAAWLKRRQRHLAINAVFYASTVWFERCHVMHHLAACPPVVPTETCSNDLKSAA